MGQKIDNTNRDNFDTLGKYSPKIAKKSEPPKYSLIYLI
jgi:hypothetical protein